MKIKKCLVHNPTQEFHSLTRPKVFGFIDMPNPTLAEKQHNAFISTIASEGVKVYSMMKHITTKPSLYKIRDLAFVHDNNALICNLSMSYRKGEERLVKETLKQINIKIKSQVYLPGILDGGNILFLNEKTVMIGIGNKANEHGIKQFKETFPELQVIKLPFNENLDLYMNMIDNTIVMSEELTYTEIYTKLKEMEYDFIIATSEDTKNKAIDFIQLKNNKIVNVPSSLNKKLKMMGFDVIEVDISELTKGNTGCGRMCLPLDYSF